MASESELLRLIALIYDAAQDPALWPQFLEQYATVLGGTITFLHWHRLAERSSALVALFGVDNAVRDSYHSYYSGLNVWRNHAQAKFVQGKVLIDEELYPRALLEKSEFYNDYLVKLNGVFSITGVIARRPAESLHLTALRNQRQAQWTASDKRIVQTLLPHVIRAHAMTERLEIADAGAAVVNTLGVAVFFLGPIGEVVECNQAAEAILRSNDGLLLQSGLVRASTSHADAQLRETIRGAATGLVSLDCPEAVLIPRPSAKQSYQVLVAPLRHTPAEHVGLRTPRAVMLVVDPAAERLTARETLMRLFGLTRREAALASAMSAGKTVEQAAEQLGITYETARSHLRRVFGKTQTSRQAELIVLLSRLPKEP